MANPWITLFRDGETLGGDVIRALMALDAPVMNAASSVGTGFSAGQVNTMNGRGSIAQPNHFFVTADGVTKVITIQPGIYYVQKDSGLVSFNPEVITICLTQALTFTVPNNAQGTSRTDTICLRVDQSTSPDSTGSNLASIVDVQGGASNVLGNAPNDGALYIPICLIVLSNGFTFITQANVTDKRLGAYNGRYKASAALGVNTNLVSGIATAVPFDTKNYDPNGDFTTGTGAKFTAPVPGFYQANSTLRLNSVTTATEYIYFLYKNGVEVKRGTNQVVAVVSPGYFSLQVAAQVQLAAGDTLQVFAMQSTGSTITMIGSSTLTYFDIHLLSVAP